MSGSKHRKMLWVGLTGGIATGKSTVARVLREAGIEVIDADALAREAVEIGTAGFVEIVKEFGDGVLTSDGRLERRALGRAVFGQPERLKRLEAIIHPRVRERQRQLREELESKGQAIAVYDVPLLFEKNLDSEFDHTVVVVCSPETQLRRLIQRDQLSDDEARKRIDSQLSLEAKVKRAGHVIRNDGSIEELKAQTLAVFSRLTEGFGKAHDGVASGPCDHVHDHHHHDHRHVGSHDHGHHHGHHHHAHHGHHHHGHGADLGSKNIAVAFALNLSFALIEIAGSFYTGSIAILADAVHDLGDSVSLGLAFALQRIALRRRTKEYTYGYGRFSLLSALLTGLVIFVGSAVVLWEAVPRLWSPGQPPLGWGMAGLALLGIGVNLAAFLRLRRGQTRAEAALTWHFVEDVLGWAAVLVGGVIVAVTGWAWVDPLLAIGVALFVLWNISKHLLETVPLFLQSAPATFSEEKFRADVLKIPGVAGVHDLHAWSIDGASNVLSLHLVVGVAAADASSVARIKKTVREISGRYGRFHTTIELEYEDDPCDVDCESDSPTESNLRRST